MTSSKEMENDGEIRFRDYIQKIAAGPRQSKDLTQEQTAVFLIAARMKRETLEENLGYWQALDRSTVKQSVRVKKLLQIAEPFDGFNRTPCFGFYAIPVIAEIGLPCYGHSGRGLPPKFGLTFEEILHGHYRIDRKASVNIRFLEERGFCFVGLHQSHPKLEALGHLRAEMVKRSVLATFEKMLMPLQADIGENLLATTYFHRGYEEPMIAAARMTRFVTAIIGNGLESTTLFGVHKAAEVYIVEGGAEVVKQRVDVSDALSDSQAGQIREVYTELKTKKNQLADVTYWGEKALKNGSGPAAPLIAWQAGSLAYFAGEFTTFKEGFEAAQAVLQSGKSYRHLMEFINHGSEGGGTV